MDEYYRAVEALPSWLARLLCELPAEKAAQIHELRLRVGCGLVLTVDGAQQTANALHWVPHALRELRFTQAQLEEILFCLCGGSVHTHQAELAQGYVTLPDGCRAGIGGRFLVHPKQGVILQEISSVNLRIARRKTPVLPRELTDALAGHFTGALLVGEPDSGKTTLLRAIACHLAAQGRSVVVLDERRELFAQAGNRPGETGAPLDVVAGLPKSLAIPMALRTLSPQILLLDELGGVDEAAALRQGMFGGVDFVATVHAPSAAEALRRPQVNALRVCGALRVLISLKDRRRPGEIAEVMRL